MNEPLNACLAMIVRDESRIVARALRSVRPWIKAWSVVDTGSRDATPAIVEQELAGIPGSLHRRPWVSFAHNRQEALKLAERMGCDWLLILDADQELLPQSAPFAEPPADINLVNARCEFNEYLIDVKLLVRAGSHYHYELPTHESMIIAGEMRTEAFRVRENADSSRRKSGRKVCEDIFLLTRFLAEDPGNQRARYYLAATLKDAGLFEAAIAEYAEAGTPYAVLEIARLMRFTGYPLGEVLAIYSRAAKVAPWRAEPHTELATIFYARGEYEYAHTHARTALSKGIPLNDGGLVDVPAYTWRPAILGAQSAEALGDKLEALALYRLALASSGIPRPDAVLAKRGLERCKQAA